MTGASPGPSDAPRRKPPAATEKCLRAWSVLQGHPAPVHAGGPEGPSAALARPGAVAPAVGGGFSGERRSSQREGRQQTALPASAVQPRLSRSLGLGRRRCRPPGPRPWLWVRPSPSSSCKCSSQSRPRGALRVHVNEPRSPSPGLGRTYCSGPCAFRAGGPGRRRRGASRGTGEERRARTPALPPKGRCSKPQPARTVARVPHARHSRTKHRAPCTRSRHAGRMPGGRRHCWTAWRACAGPGGVRETPRLWGRVCEGRSEPWGCPFSPNPAGQPRSQHANKNL